MMLYFALLPWAMKPQFYTLDWDGSNYKQAEAELGQAQLKLELDFTLIFF